jgi:hypothetical protein
MEFGAADGSTASVARSPQRKSMAVVFPPADGSPLQRINGQEDGHPHEPPGPSDNYGADIATLVELLESGRLRAFKHSRIRMARRLSGTAIEQAIVSALCDAAGSDAPPDRAMLFAAPAQTRPLSVPMREQMNALRVGTPGYCVEADCPRRR